MIAFKDFTPKELSSAGFLRSAAHERFESAALRANEWVATNNIRIINIETVVLPNIHSPHEEGPTDPLLRTSGEMGSAWYQIIRVWYHFEQQSEDADLERRREALQRISSNAEDAK